MENLKLGIEMGNGEWGGARLASSQPASQPASEVIGGCRRKQHVALQPLQSTITVLHTTA
jgi:hypothetical protein